MNRILVEIIVYLAAFLDMSDEDIIDERAAVKQLDSLAWQLQQLTPAERAEFVKIVDEIRKVEGQEPGRQKYVEFLATFAENMGLLDEDGTPN